MFGLALLAVIPAFYDPNGQVVPAPFRRLAPPLWIPPEASRTAFGCTTGFGENDGGRGLGLRSSGFLPSLILTARGAVGRPRARDREGDGARRVLEPQVTIFTCK